MKTTKLTAIATARREWRRAEQNLRMAEAQRAYRRVVDVADRPSKIRSAGQLVRNLDAWKQDMLALARKRAKQQAKQEGSIRK